MRLCYYSICGSARCFVGKVVTELVVHWQADLGLDRYNREVEGSSINRGRLA